MKNKRNAPHSEEQLMALFQEASTEPVMVPSGLAQKVMQDAAKMQPALRSREKASSTLMSRLIGMVGGWPTFGGLAAASCAGFWIGFAPPQSLPDTGVLLMSQSDLSAVEAVELTGFGWDLEE